MKKGLGIPLINLTFKKVILTVMAIFGILISYNLAYLDKIPANTYFTNEKISGKNDDEAKKIIGDKIDAFAKKQILFITDQNTIQTDLSALGIDYDLDKTLISAIPKNKRSRPIPALISRLIAPFKKHDALANFSIDYSKFSNQISELLTAYETKELEATIVFSNGKFQVQNEQQGTLIDKQKLIADLRENLKYLQSEPILLTKYESQPKMKEEHLKKALEKVTLLNNQKIVLTYDRDNWSLSGKTLIDLLTFYPKGRENAYLAGLQITKSPIFIANVYLKDNPQPLIDVSLDSHKLEDFLWDIAKSIDTPTVDATLRFEGGKVVEFRPARDGQKLDVVKTKTLVLEKVSIDNSSLEKISTINLPVNVTSAKIANEEINSLGIHQLIARGISYFAGSIPNRIHNISLGAARINGTLVKPGENFSFNQIVGEVSQATGYKQAYVISKGRTVLDDGGGICQVSTTIFRAALAAGLPIIQRTAHAYRVSYYEQGGFKPGLDATVWSPAVDFSFKNDTPNHLLVQTIVDRQRSKLQIDIYGTDDGRKVTMTEPVVTNQKPPPPDKYEEDPTLAKGIVKQVDFAAAGATAVFTRKVFMDNRLLIDESFKSNFRPWQAVYLVGSGT